MTPNPTIYCVENGFDLWIADAKNRYPLFIAAFYGRVESVAFLLEQGAGTGTGAGTKSKMDCINGKDVNGDTALHAAALNGNMQCILLLLYYIRSCANRQGLSPQMIAATPNATGTTLEKVHQTTAEIVGSDYSNITVTVNNSSFGCVLTSNAVNDTLATDSCNRNVNLIKSIENQCRSGMDVCSIYGCDFDTLASNIIYYSTRWVKCYDSYENSYYYYDSTTTRLGAWL